MNNIAQKVTLGFIVFGFLLLVIMSSQVFETNHAGYIQVKQAAGTGTMTVRRDPGVYLQLFGTITEYKVSDVYDFNSKEQQIGVRFNDASTADVSGQIKFRLPTTEEGILRIHRDFRSYDAIHDQMVRQVVSSALKQAATYFRAEDVYSTHRADFVDLVNDQIKAGIYATTYTEEWHKDADTLETKLIKKVNVRTDKNNEPLVNEESAFHIYGIELIQFVVNDIDFDDKTDSLIAKRKEAEQEMVVAKANAERAKQDAMTAVEQGKANVALAEAKALVEKKTAVVAAEMKTAVAEQAALQADQEKRAIIAKGEADAASTKLKVAAGLSPGEQAEFRMKTAIGVAGELAKIHLPKLMVMGGGNGANGGQVNPFDAVGLEAFIRMSEKLSDHEDNKEK